LGGALITAPWAVGIGVLGRLPFLKTRNQHQNSQNLSAGSCGRKEIEGFFDEKELSVHGLVRVITDEARMWRQAGAQISLVDQYGGTPL
jgi:hypothetical protein